MTQEKKQFEAEVSRLLDIVAHALYSDREVFLRELVSNASDACDHHRYKALTNKNIKEEAQYAVKLSADKDNNTLTISDNGIGMDKDDLVENLGTIARSGTAALMEQVVKSKKQEGSQVNLIGQFGVGFYAAFMVADKVEVVTRKATDDTAWLWTSDGKSGYVIDSAKKDSHGTDVVLYLKDDAKEFLEKPRLENVVQKYSDHISIPILFGEDRLNQASALWQRPKNEISDDDYKQFYKHVSHAGDDPWTHIHWKAEGKFEYTGLLYIPSVRPHDIFDPRREHHVKLYVKRVFISDRVEGLVPPYLRFVKGVVDSADLPLNISRETLQHNPLIAKIGSALTKKVLSEIKSLSQKDEVGFKDFWYNFGQVIKEGLYEDATNRDAIFDICRFHSTHGEEQTSLPDYVERMKADQKAIYYLVGENLNVLQKSPQLEAFRKQGIEVLLLNEPIDEYWLPVVDSYKGKPLKSAIRSASDLTGESDDDSKDKDGDSSKVDEKTPLTSFIKETLGDQVRTVRLSKRLTESPVCLVTDEGDLDPHIERLLKMQGKMETAFTRIMEVNPDHPVIQKLQGLAEEGGAKDSELAKDMVWLLLDQARIAEGEAVLDPAEFNRRLSKAIEKGLAA